METLGQIPPNLVFLFGVTEPVEWTVPPRPWPGENDAPMDSSRDDTEHSFYNPGQLADMATGSMIDVC